MDFEYVDEQGETHTWSFPGTGRYAIANIMSEIGVEGTITDVQLARTIDVGCEDNALYLSDDHTELVSDVAFQDTFELTVKVQQTVEEDTVEKTYVIVVTDNTGIQFSYEVELNIENGTTLPDNLYIVGKLLFRVVENNSTNTRESKVFTRVEGNKTYTLTGSYWIYDDNATQNGLSSVDLYLACPKDGATEFQEYMVGYEIEKYNDGDIIDEKNIIIDTSKSPWSITIGDVLPTTYTASLSFVDQTSDTLTVPALTGYTLVGSDDTDTYIANLANGTLSFTKTSDNSSVPELPKITSWTFKHGNDTVTAIDGFELSLTPETTTVSSNETSVLKNYAFTATKYQNCGLSIDGLSNTSAVQNYWVLVKQGSEYKYYAKMSELGTIYNADGTPASAIKGSSGYEFEVVEYSGTPNSVNDLSNQQKKPNPFPITVSDATKLVTFPTQATEQSGNYNYVFTVAEPPKYSATVQAVASDGTNPISDPGVTGDYYVMVQVPFGSARFAVSERTVNFSGSTP